MQPLWAAVGKHFDSYKISLSAQAHKDYKFNQ